LCCEFTFLSLCYSTLWWFALATPLIEVRFRSRLWVNMMLCTWQGALDTYGLVQWTVDHCVVQEIISVFAVNDSLPHMLSHCVCGRHRHTCVHGSHNTVCMCVGRTSSHTRCVSEEVAKRGEAHSLELQAARCANLWRSSTLLGYHNMVAWLQGFPSMAMSHFHMEGREMGGRGGWQLTAVDYMLCVRYLHWYVCSQLSHAHKDTSTTRSYTLCFWDVGSVWCC